MRLGPDDVAELEATAKARGVSVSEVVRVAVQEHLARRQGDRVLPLLDQGFARHTDRLAALISKVYVAASAASWPATYIIGRDQKVGMDEAREIWRSAQVRALVDLRRKGCGLGEAEEEEYRAAEARAGVEDPSQ